MALTRKMLKAMGIEEEKIDQIIEAHTETVDALKEQRDNYKKDADKLPGVQKELEDLREAGGDGGYKDKYEKEHAAFEKYKTEQAEKETDANKRSAYKALLKDAGVSEKRIDTILKVLDLSEIELDDKGKIKNSDEVTEKIKSEWADFIVTDGKKGAETTTPPSNTGGKTMTKEEIMAIKDGTERRKAIAENPQLFGLPTDSE